MIDSYRSNYSTALQVRLSFEIHRKKMLQPFSCTCIHTYINIFIFYVFALAENLHDPPNTVISFLFTTYILNKGK